MNYIFSINIYI
uniref:Uncharacterized protein n=1 Tax=Anguilla anguilla TaxID=7936 RepID=A0A0E9Q9K9_ANGAN